MENRKTKFEALPSDVLERVLSTLPLGDALRCAAVNRGLHRASMFLPQIDLAPLAARLPGPDAETCTNKRCAIHHDLPAASGPDDENSTDDGESNTEFTTRDDDDDTSNSTDPGEINADDDATLEDCRADDARARLDAAAACAASRVTRAFEVSLRDCGNLGPARIAHVLESMGASRTLSTIDVSMCGSVGAALASCAATWPRLAVLRAAHVSGLEPHQDGLQQRLQRPPPGGGGGGGGGGGDRIDGDNVNIFRAISKSGARLRELDLAWSDAAPRRLYELGDAVVLGSLAKINLSHTRFRADAGHPAASGTGGGGGGGVDQGFFLCGPVAAGFNDDRGGAGRCFCDDPQRVCLALRSIAVARARGTGPAIASRIVRSIACHAPHLRVLNITEMAHAPSRDLAALLSALPELVDLELTGCIGWDTEVARALCESACAPTLRRLAVSHCTNFVDAHLSLIAAHCGALETLEAEFSLFLSDTRRVTGLGVAELAAGCGALTHLDIARRTVVDADAVEALVTGCGATLEALRLDGCSGLAEDCRRWMARVGDRAPRLAALSLRGITHITRAALLALCAGRHATQIRRLDLSYIDGVDAEVLDTIVAQLTGLRALSVAFCRNLAQHGDGERVAAAIQRLEDRGCAVEHDAAFHRRKDDAIRALAAFYR